MTTYPGDDPQQPDDPQTPAAEAPKGDEPTAAYPEDTEPTQPVGYWERRAKEEAAEQAGARGSQPYPTTPYTQGGPVFNPTSAQASPPQPAPPVPSPQPAPGYAQGSQGGPSPYGQGSYGQAPYPQPTPPSYGGQPVPYAPVPAYGGFVARPPDHPQAMLALILGLVGLVGAFLFCGFPLLVSPFAWGIGHSALKGIRASQGRLGGESQARTGMILGIVGTVLAILLVLFLVVVFALAISADTSTVVDTSTNA